MKRREPTNLRPPPSLPPAACARRHYGLRAVLALVLVTAAAVAVPPPAPEAAVVLSPQAFWASKRWPGVDWSRAAAVSAHAGHPRFTVREPGRGHVWLYRLHVPVERGTYPVLSVTYRAEGIDTAAGFALWLDDGRGTVYGGWTPVDAADLVADSESHTLRRDLSTQDGSEPITAVALAVRSGSEAPGWLELIDLRFEAQTPGSAPAAGAPVTVEVTDGDGEAVAGARVTIDAERDNWARHGRTEADGTAVLEPLATSSGLHMLRVAKTGHVAVEQVLRRGETEARVTLVRGTMYGGLVTVAGQPMPGTAVRAHVRHRLAALMRPTPVVFTDSQGRWRTPVLPAADIELGLRLWHADVGAPMYVAQPSLSELAAGTSRIAMVGTELDVHRAAQLGKVDWLRQALAREPVLVRRQQDRHTPLHIAARFDRPEVVDVLVEAGADLEDMGPGSTALHDAVEFGSLAVARRLLERGANPDTRNVADSAPFHHAIWAQSDGLCTAAELLASVELLVEYGADVNAVHRGVGTPLDYALRVAPQPVVAALTRHGAHTSE